MVLPRPAVDHVLRGAVHRRMPRVQPLAVKVAVPVRVCREDADRLPGVPLRQSQDAARPDRVVLRELMMIGDNFRGFMIKWMVL